MDLSVFVSWAFDGAKNTRDRQPTSSETRKNRDAPEVKLRMNLVVCLSKGIMRALYDNASSSNWLCVAASHLDAAFPARLHHRLSLYPQSPQLNHCPPNFIHLGWKSTGQEPSEHQQPGIHGDDGAVHELVDDAVGGGIASAPCRIGSGVSFSHAGIVPQVRLPHGLS